jgi:hypothetical protein
MTTNPSSDRVSPFRWNAGGWFGSQLGGTLWLLVGGGLLAASDPAVALVWFGCFVAANALGFFLWRQRHRLAAHAALQLFLGTLAVLSLLAIMAADWSGNLPRLAAGHENPRVAAYGALLVFPGLQLLFWLQQHFGQAAPPARERP